MIAQARRAGLLLAVGTILFVFSERMFWSFWRRGDEVAAYAGGLLLYTFLGYVLLAVCRHFQVRDLGALFLAGACFGWLDEGVVAMTLFGDPSMPFPLTVSWTGLAWHALITVMLGFHALRRSLLADRVWPALGLSLGLGIFWGVWGAGWAAETPPIGPAPLDFAAHAAVATAALAIAELALEPAGLATFHPSRAGLAIAAMVIVGFFGAVTVPAVPYAPLVLLPLAAVVLSALRRTRVPDGSADLLSVMGGKVRPRNLAGLMGIPVAATGTYMTLIATEDVVPLHLIVAVATTVAGFGFLFVTLYRVWRADPTSRKSLATAALR